MYVIWSDHVPQRGLNLETIYPIGMGTSSFSLTTKLSIDRKKASVEAAGDKILKIDLGLNFESKQELIPDPYLWGLKAGSAWGGYCSQQTLMSCNADGPPFEFTFMEGVDTIDCDECRSSLSGSFMSSVGNSMTD